MEAINKNQRTLKHIHFRFPRYASNKSASGSVGNANWGKESLRKAIAACGIDLVFPNQVTLHALESLEVSDFELSPEEAQEAMSMLNINVVIKSHQLKALRFRNCGYIDSIIWPSITPFQISVLHLTVNVDCAMVYDFLEKQETATTLTELRLIVAVKQETRFPDLRRHAKTLRILYLAVINGYDNQPRAGAARGVALMCPTPMGTIHQLMSFPRLEQLAITFPNPNTSSFKLDERSFPSLRALWILSASGLIEPKQLRGGFWALLSTTPTPPPAEQAKIRKGHLDRIFRKPKYYPNKLEIIGIGLKPNQEHPEDILVIPKAIPPNCQPESEVIIQDFNRVYKAMSILVPESLSRDEYSWIEIFELGKGIWGDRTWY
ncbi:hypothetical protein TWF481_000567 [Arthrobotrys musiformis]|uniref:F-box domain-containing protein n=1 Tax=Arthrobotrys musiformis TaxID=47236 RepID=A0AAV9WNA4_9PEZI